MYAPTVVFRRLSDGIQKTLGPGGILGRLHNADLRFDHPGVSEAHAMVSLRQQGLMLLSLRGRLKVGGEHLVDLVLVRGQIIELIQGDLDPGTSPERVEVVAVQSPEEILALESRGVEVARLLGGELYLAERSSRGRMELVALQHPVPDLLARVWCSGERFSVQLCDGRIHALQPGQRLETGGRVIDVVARTPPVCKPTQVHLSSGPSLLLQLGSSGARFLLDGQERLLLAGRPFELLFALHGSRPSPWHELAARIWPRTERGKLRDRWDKTLHDLRDELRNHGIERLSVEDPQGGRDDRRALVRSVNGEWSLNLLPGDRVELER